MALTDCPEELAEWRKALKTFSIWSMIKNFPSWVRGKRQASTRQRGACFTHRRTFPTFGLWTLDSWLSWYRVVELHLMDSPILHAYWMPLYAVIIYAIYALGTLLALTLSDKALRQCALIPATAWFKLQHCLQVGRWSSDSTERDISFLLALLPLRSKEKRISASLCNLTHAKRKS